MMRPALVFALAALGCNPAPSTGTDATDTDAGLGGPGPDHDTLEQDEDGCYLLQGARSADLALVDSVCYRLTGLFEVSSARLSAGPGTAITAAADGGLLIGPDADIQFEGSATSPIQITPELRGDDDANAQAGGAWKGVYVRSEVVSRLHYVHLEGASGSIGQGPAAALTLTGVASLRELTLLDSGGHALRLEPTARLSDLSMSTFGAAGLATIQLSAAQLRELGPGLEFTASDARIEVTDANLTGGTHVWQPQPVPIHIAGTVDVRSADVTFEPGLQLHFLPGTALQFDLDTQLRSLGQADAPVVLRGTDGPGSWRGLFVRSRSAESLLQHTHILDGGAARYLNAEADNANLVLSDEARLIVAHCRFEGSGGYGMSVTSSGHPMFQGPSSFEGNAWGSLRVSARHLADLNDELSFDDEGPIRVRAGTLNGHPGTWPALDVPYEVEGLITLRNAAVVVGAGAHLLLHEDAGIQVESTASLTAVGRDDAPIHFEGLIAGEGTWRGLAFASSSALNQIQHATISGAGGLAFGGEAAAVAVLPGGRLRVLDATVSDSAGWGIWRGNNAVLDPNPPTNMSYSNNALGDLN